MTLRHRIHRVRRALRKIDTLVLEEAPLHTERPEWLAHAPEQAEAAFQRKAHVIGFTELAHHPGLWETLKTLAFKHGYILFRYNEDSAIAYRVHLPVVETGITGHLTYVEFAFHGRRVVVFVGHWPTNHPDHQAERADLTGEVVAAMRSASRRSAVSFVMADANPTKPLKDPTGQPRKALNDEGILLANEELGEFPADLGVTLVARNGADKAVTAHALSLEPALGSDHAPLHVMYEVKRPA